MKTTLKSSLQSLGFVILVLTGFFVVGTAQAQKLFRSGEPIRSMNKLERKMKQMAENFVRAEHHGDFNLLLKLTKLEAHQAIKSIDRRSFVRTRLNRIVYFDFVAGDDKDNMEVIVSISDFGARGKIRPDFYEIIYFRKFGKNWYVVRTERDA